MIASDFRILPVIDLMGGQVVRGWGGNRDRYAPIQQSRLAADSSPASVARALEAMALPEVYVADLDAIAGGAPDFESLEQIAACGLRIWLDCGTGSAAMVKALQADEANRRRIASLVVGLESIGRLDDLSDIAAMIGPERSVFSLDLKHGQPQTDAAELSAVDWAKAALQAGFARIIVLDLAYVGGDRVGVAELCRQIHGACPQLEILAGGGVQSTADMRLLAQAGCSGVLVSTALHNGSVTERGLARFRREMSDL